MSVKRTGTRRDQRVLKALGHPLRQRLLQALNQRVASPSELAAECGERVTNVAYHVKVLEQQGAIELVKTAPARGSIEHFYRATMRPSIDDQHWAALSLSARRALFDQTLDDRWDDVAAAAEDGRLDDTRTHISRTWLELDDQAYEELDGLLSEVMDRALELHAEATFHVTEPSDEERESHRTALAMMHFPRRSPKRG